MRVSDNIHNRTHTAMDVNINIGIVRLVGWRGSRCNQRVGAECGFLCLSHAHIGRLRNVGRFIAHKPVSNVVVFIDKTFSSCIRPVIYLYYTY